MSITARAATISGTKNQPECQNCTKNSFPSIARGIRNITPRKRSIKTLKNIITDLNFK
jgi:hypothetical protein